MLQAGFMRWLVAVVAISGCAHSGSGVDPDAGGGDDVTVDADPGADAAPPIRACATRFSYRPTGAVDSVELAGEWDWDARTPMTDADGDGAFEVDHELGAGLYAYKFVVTRPGGAVEWVLDPVNRYRAYDDGVENSGMRVEDCASPLLELVDHTATQTRVRVWRGVTATPVTSLDVTLRHDGSEAAVAYDFDGAELTVAFETLAPGKYTLAIHATDAAGAPARPLLLPFWIEDEPFDWKGSLIYMVMTDRFRNGDPSNDPAALPAAEAAADFHGGDLAGVTAAILDGTFDDLGVAALWLSPFVENAAGTEAENGHGVSAYHGYWPIASRSIDPRLGTEADLDALVTAAHQHGIRVLMDDVLNHVHEDHAYVSTHPDWFRTGCECGQPGCDWTAHRLDCSFHAYMPDFDWQNREASEARIADSLWWLERFDLDGLRVDAVKHVEDLAILNLATRVRETFEQAGTRYFLLGETAMGWNGDDVAASLSEYQTISRYIGTDALDGQFDFVLYHATAYRVFADEAKGMLHLDYWTRQSQLQYPTEAVMTPFVGSHDSERLVSLATYGSGDPLVHHKWVADGLPAAPSSEVPYQKAAVALTWLLTSPGAPLLYYGDEYGEHGGADPDNRHDWKAPAARTAWQTAMAAKIARVGQLRRELAPLRLGDYVPLTVTEDVVSFARTHDGDTAIVVINRDDAATTVQIAAPATVADGVLVDRLDAGERTVSVSGGQISVPMAARSAAVLVP